jgi:hypothetical protein
MLLPQLRKALEGASDFYLPKNWKLTTLSKVVVEKRLPILNEVRELVEKQKNEKEMRPPYPFMEENNSNTTN